MANVIMRHDKNRFITEIDKTDDLSWMKGTFLLQDGDLSDGTEYGEWVRANRFYVTADSKIASTSPGMSIAVNPKPQFTRYADIRSAGKITEEMRRVSINSRPGEYGFGLGHYYSEAFDDNAQRIFMTFGVPEYTSILVWMTKAFDVEKAAMANRGIIAQTVIEAIGIVTKVIAWFSAPLLGIAATIINAFVANTRFYNVKDTMYMYWSSVETILNSMVARRTMAPMFLKDYTAGLDNRVNTTQSVQSQSEAPMSNGEKHLSSGMIKEEVLNDDGSMKFDPENDTTSYLTESGQGFVDKLNEVLPNVVSNTTGRISVHAIALRYQMAYNRILLEEARLMEEQGPNILSNNLGYNPVKPLSSNTRTEGITTHDTYFSTSEGKVRNLVSIMLKFAHEKLLHTDAKYLGKKGGDVYIGVDGDNEFQPTIDYNPAFTDEDGNPMVISYLNEEGNPEDDIINNIRRQKDTWYKRMKEYTLAELTDGAMFAVFEVEPTGSVGESFSNSVAPNPIESMFNSISAQSRNVTRTISSFGNILPIMTDVIKFAGDVASTMISNASFGLANPILALAYGLEVKMPKVWDSSTASLPRASYRMRLVSPYGNPYSQLFNVYLPMAMLMAGGLPRATGKASYTSPFVCRLFDRGRLNIQLGMIDSINFTRGTSTLAFTRRGDTNAVDVDFTVANLDEVIAVDIANLGLFSRAKEAISLDYSPDTFTEYLNAITAVSVYDQIMRIPQLRLKAAEKWMGFSAAFVEPDPAAYAAFTGNRLIPKGISSLVFGMPGRASDLNVNS